MEGLGVEDYFCAFVRLCLIRVGRLYFSASVRLPGERQLQSQSPGPLAAAGLPFLAIGYGAYWVFKRRRKTD